MDSSGIGQEKTEKLLNRSRLDKLRFTDTVDGYKKSSPIEKQIDGDSRSSQCGKIQVPDEVTCVYHISVIQKLLLDLIFL